MTNTLTVDSTTLRDFVARSGVTPSRLTPFADGSPLLTQPSANRGTLAIPVMDVGFELLRIAHTARALVQLDLVLEGGVFDHLVCFGGGPDTVLLSPGPAGLSVRGPAPVEELIEGVANYFGSSLIRAVPFTASVDARAAVALTAALDLERSRALHQLAGSPETAPASFDAATLAEATSRSPASFNSLTAVLAAVAGNAHALDAADAASAVVSLSQAGLVSGGPVGYTLAGDALAIARRFLVLGSMLRLRVARESEQGEIYKASLWFLQAGVHDVLMLELVDGSLLLETLSAALVLDMVRRLLSDPETVSAGPASPPEQGKHGTQLMPAFPAR